MACALRRASMVATSTLLLVAGAVAIGDTDAGVGTVKWNCVGKSSLFVNGAKVAHACNRHSVKTYTGPLGVGDTITVRTVHPRGASKQSGCSFDVSYPGQPTDEAVEAGNATALVWRALPLTSVAMTQDASLVAAGQFTHCRWSEVATVLGGCGLQASSKPDAPFLWPPGGAAIGAIFSTVLGLPFDGCADGGLFISGGTHVESYWNGKRRVDTVDGALGVSAGDGTPLKAGDVFAVNVLDDSEQFGVSLLIGSPTFDRRSSPGLRGLEGDWVATRATPDLLQDNKWAWEDLPESCFWEPLERTPWQMANGTLAQMGAPRVWATGEKGGRIIIRSAYQMAGGNAVCSCED